MGRPTRVMDVDARPSTWQSRLNGSAHAAAADLEVVAGLHGAHVVLRQWSSWRKRNSPTSSAGNTTLMFASLRPTYSSALRLLWDLKERKWHALRLPLAVYEHEVPLVHAAAHQSEAHRRVNTDRAAFFAAAWRWNVSMSSLRRRSLVSCGGLAAGHFAPLHTSGTSSLYL